MGNKAGRGDMQSALSQQAAAMQGLQGIPGLQGLQGMSGMPGMPGLPGMPRSFADEVAAASAGFGQFLQPPPPQTSQFGLPFQLQQLAAQMPMMHGMTPMNLNMPPLQLPTPPPPPPPQPQHDWAAHFAAAAAAAVPQPPPPPPSFPVQQLMQPLVQQMAPPPPPPQHQQQPPVQYYVHSTVPVQTTPTSAAPMAPPMSATFDQPTMSTQQAPIQTHYTHNLSTMSYSPSVWPPQPPPTPPNQHYHGSMPFPGQGGTTSMHTTPRPKVKVVNYPPVPIRY